MKNAILIARTSMENRYSNHIMPSGVIVTLISLASPQVYGGPDNGGLKSIFASIYWVTTVFMQRQA